MRALLLLVLVGCEASPGQQVEPPGPDSPALSYSTLATGPSGVFDLAVDDSHVYWLVSDQMHQHSEVHRVLKSGGPSELVTTIEGTVYEFAIDDTSIYVPTYAQDSTGKLLRISKASGATEVIDSGLNYLAFVAVADSSVYVAPESGTPFVPDSQLWRYPKAGGSHEVIVDGLRGPDTIVFDSNTLYVTNAGDSSLRAAPRDGGDAVEPLPDLNAIRVVGDATNLYFLSGAIGQCPDGHISSWSRTGTELRDLGASPTCPVDLAVNASSVFSAEWAGRIVEFPLDGSGRHELVTGLSAPNAIAVESSSVYWGDFVTGEINRYDL